MKKYYLCDVIGDGSFDSPYRPAVADMGVDHVSVIASDPVTGKPAKAWCLTLVATVDHDKVVSAGGVDPLPDAALDAAVNGISKGKLDAAKAALARRGASVPSVSPGDDYGAFVRGVGRQLDPGFSEANFDVAGG